MAVKQASASAPGSVALKHLHNFVGVCSWIKTEDTSKMVCTGSGKKNIKGKTVLLSVRKRMGETTSWQLHQNQPGSLHAEEVFLDCLESLEDGTCTDTQHVIYINYSPCANCAKKLSEFFSPLDDREIYLSIKYINPYQTEGYQFTDSKKFQNKQRLRDLSKVPNITISVMTANDWLDLIRSLQDKQPEYDEINNNDQDNILPFVEHIADKFANLVHQTKLIEQTRNEYRQVFRNWCECIMEKPVPAVRTYKAQT